MEAAYGGADSRMRRIAGAREITAAGLLMKSAGDSSGQSELKRRGFFLTARIDRMFNFPENRVMYVI